MKPLPPLVRLGLPLLAAAGLLLPWYFNLAYFLGGGSVAPGVFFRDAFANALTSAITVDVYLAAFAFSVGVAADRQRRRARWLAVPACFGIGLAVALPLYLLWRARPSSVSPAAGQGRRLSA